MHSITMDNPLPIPDASTIWRFYSAMIYGTLPVEVFTCAFDFICSWKVSCKLSVVLDYLLCISDLSVIECQERRVLLHNSVGIRKSSWRFSEEERNRKQGRKIVGSVIILQWRMWHWNAFHNFPIFHISERTVNRVFAHPNPCQQISVDKILRRLDSISLSKKLETVSEINATLFKKYRWV